MPLSECPTLKEVIAEGCEANEVSANLCTAHVCVHGSAQKKPKVESFLCCVCPRSSARLWYGVGWGLGLGVVAAGIEVAVVLPEIWAASVADFSQDLSAPDLGLSYGMEWVEPGCFAGKGNTAYSCPGLV